MMPDSAFDQLAEDAAAGLKGDQELFLDVKQELCAHLEDKADALRAQGHSEEESDDLARKAFGSPLAVAAELVAANAGRMSRRALARLAFWVVVVPLAMVLALYVGYMRFARLQAAAMELGNVASAIIEPCILPALPGTTKQTDVTDCKDNYFKRKAPLVQQLSYGNRNSEKVYQYWEDHQHDPDAKIYYAYYALFADQHETQYAAVMQKGEQIEPQNALYNLFLAEYYLQKGISSKLDKAQDDKKPPTDDVLDRRAFSQGIAELRKAVAKPFLHTYQARILQIKLNALPPALLTEDYLAPLVIEASESSPYCYLFWKLAEKIPGCARVLLAEDHRAEAEVVMDTWRPYLKLLMSEEDPSLLHALNIQVVGNNLFRQAPIVYTRLGATTKASETMSLYTRWQRTEKGSRLPEAEQTLNKALFSQHCSILMNKLSPIAEDEYRSTESMLQPSRMHEHALIDQLLVEGVVLLLIVAMLFLLVDGAIWFFTHLKSGLRPLLLLPARQLFRAVLLGIALPIAIYWVYSRLPVIGGREFNWTSHWPRFGTEWLLLAMVLLWLPAFSFCRYLYRRCAELGVVQPKRKQVLLVNLRTWALILVAIFIGVFPNWMQDDMTVALFGGFLLATILLLAAGYACYRAKQWPLIPRLFIIITGLGGGGLAASSDHPVIVSVILRIIAVMLLFTAIYSYYQLKSKFSQYHGTVALSLASLCAFSVLFLSLVIQPWLMANEAYWLRQDTVLWNHSSFARQRLVGLSTIEEQEAAKFLERLDKALKGGA